MTGHHGWGYGQNDGRRRPRPAAMRWHSPPTLASGQVSRTRKSPTSRHSRQLQCAASYAQPLKAALARTWARTFTHSPLAGAGDGGGLGQRGRSGRSAVRGCQCRERAPRVCGDLPGAGLSVCKGAGPWQRVSPRGVRAYLSTGPSQWHKLYPIAQGDRQSPINIVSSQAVYSPSLKPLELSYEACTSLSIANNGHSVQVEFNDSDDRTVVTGGPLDGPYRLKQFHFHWGKKHNVGSEHTVDGKSFPSELHLVHWNAKKYSTFGEAASAPDGLAVVGVFLETGDEHPSMNRLTDALYMVRFKDTKAQFNCFNPKCLLPASRHFWTYPGSLTTPPLSESVTWIILREPISISERQMEKFRSLLITSEDDERIHMVNNFRPPQPLKGRVVKASFRA
ncbi:carbonic anhydrase 7 [Pteropus medius]|uniref:carbonic anhydrase 7 n=1 Tax=Pteropus vampyrus TaxID=132908 RepID=UPI00196A28EF|nr:carbonic anhydrase 7 [Pteropus giganteus]